ncbi:MAG: DNA-directed RNA polymerase subunit beta [Candidatus Yanofskybacteria bacterium GW2011_GWC2_41_9]|uniref:DNA-directed RNA polymerase subunit beta n=1 Tax=Candidatus Yanofskybacteria bacterium GW2011_GWC2_41_9 TaxID=1619029 RepID=A0A0G0XNY7_9BACT|nr:MAG: DNA-directed RNA polymerase subunit beta [Candidatus Yanofskybacteria bacterium GW2011_GWC2_41_9]
MFKQTKSFAKQKIKWVELPNFVAMQLDSYDWFLKNGLKELFEEMSPVTDYTGKELELYFHDYYFDEPKFDELKAKHNGLSFEAPLRVRVELINKRTKKAKEQETYLGDFPIMTERGTFIVNGVERVVVSQLIRSAGVFFSATLWRNRKLFGAKIIPNRGAWLEFETDPDGVISVKIDRKRKTPVTALLRAFSAQKSDAQKGVRLQKSPKSDSRIHDTNEDILKLFKDIDTGDIKYIEATLKKDPSKNADEGFIEIYKRLRPGDPATPENARALVEGMFKRFDRYDLGKVGRFKMNQRLENQKSKIKNQNYEYSKEERLLSFDNLVNITREIIRLNNNEDAVPDDIDHLGNRRVRSLGELLQTKLRVGLAQMERIIRDRMSTYDINTLTPAQLINARPLMAKVKEFFTSSQLAQFMDQVNPLAELEHKRRISAMGPGGLTRERAGFEVRDVHVSHYGRICPIETPEGPNIGLVVHLASYSRVNELGFIETPYVRVKNSKITGEIIWLDAFDEEKYVIAHGGTKYGSDNKISESIVEARISGKPQMVKREEVDLMDVAPQQIFSVATSLIPFLEHDDATRALMGSNMQRQAVACVKPQAPLVGTGIEERAARDSGQVVVASEGGIVAAVDAEHIAIENQKSKIKNQNDGKKIYRLNNFLRSNQFTAMSQQPLVKKGEKIKNGQAIADGAATQNGSLALGQNLLVAFLSWSGANFEDAIIISERLVRDDRFTSIHIEDYSIDIRDTKLGPEVTTPDIPNVSEEKLKNLDEEGIIRIGAEVRSGDILVGKISPKGEADLTSEERLLQAIFGEKARDVKDTSLTLPYGKRGRITAIKIFSRDAGDKLEPMVLKRVQVEVAQLRKVQSGDKLAGRHGNKGVISKILAEEDMPYLADGTPVDIILNPLGVASRMNIGQILETHLGWAADKQEFRAITPALDGATEEDIKAELSKAGLPQDGKVKLYDGRTGEPFNDKITVGIMYMMKLNHLVEDKIHMRSVGPYSLITQQPLGGKAQFGGQRFGEMEVWALEGYGAAHTLQEMITIKSDDVVGRSAAFDAIIRGEEIKKPSLPASFNVLVNELKSLGLSVELVEKSQPAEIPFEKEKESLKREVKRVRIRT